MHPIIFKIGPLTVYSFGLMLAIAVIVCAFLLREDAKKVNVSGEKAFDLIFWVTVSGVLGARIFSIILNFDYYKTYPEEIIMIQNGGLAWQGGLIAGGLGALIFANKNKLAIPVMLDLLAPYLALGQSIGRIGCFLNGCCYGIPLKNGIYFPVHHDHLHPTQLYSSIGLLVIFFVLRAFKKSSKLQGETFVLYLILAASWRFGVEFFRADHYKIVLGLSVYQYVCLGLLLGALYVRSYLKSRFRK